MSGPRKIRIVVADDHPLLRDGVRAVLASRDDMEVVGEAEDGAEAVALYRALRPDLLLTDLQMPVLDGTGAITAIRAEFPDARILVLTAYATPAQAARAVRAGARGCLLKRQDGSALIDAIRATCQGAHAGPLGLVGGSATGDDPALSDRELQVLTLAAQGNSNKRIAVQLSLSEETVKGYMKSIFVKLGATDRAHAVALAARCGVIAL